MLCRGGHNGVILNPTRSQAKTGEEGRVGLKPIKSPKRIREGRSVERSSPAMQGWSIEAWLSSLVVEAR